MAENLNDKFRKTGAATVTTLSAPGKALGASSITVGSTTNYPTDAGKIIAIRQVDTNGELVAGTYTEWKATVASATGLTIDPIPVYGNDQVYPAGSTTQVYIPLSSFAHNEMIDAILEEHNQSGGHTIDTISEKTSGHGVTIDGLNIKDGAVTTANSIPNSALAGGITYAKLLSTIFSGQVSSQANAGSAGGTMYYVNLGGIKLLWATGATITTTTTATEFIYTLPVGFFSTVQSSIASIMPVTADAKQLCNISQSTTSSTGLYVWASTTATAKTFIFVIGT